jgi:hypothetical protein
MDGERNPKKRKADERGDEPVQNKRGDEPAQSKRAKLVSNEDYARFYAGHPEVLPHITAAASTAMHAVYDAPNRDGSGRLTDDAQKKVASFDQGRGMTNPTPQDMVLAYEAGTAARNKRKILDSSGDISMKYSTSDPDIKSGYFVNNVASYKKEVDAYSKMREGGLNDQQIASLFREPTRQGVSEKLTEMMPKDTDPESIRSTSAVVFRRTALRALEASRAWDHAPFHDMALRRIEAGLEPLDAYARADAKGTSVTDREHLNPSSMVGVTKAAIDGSDPRALQESLDVKQSMLVRNLRDGEKVGDPEKNLNLALRKFADSYLDQPEGFSGRQTGDMIAARGEIVKAFEGILRTGLEQTRSPVVEPQLKPDDAQLLRSASQSGYEAPGHDRVKTRATAMEL